MAAAPSLSFDVLSIASPELALVDPELAAELRETLSPMTERYPAPVSVAIQEPPPRVEEPVLAEPGPVVADAETSADELIVFPENETLTRNTSEPVEHDASHTASPEASRISADDLILLAEDEPHSSDVSQVEVDTDESVVEPDIGIDASDDPVPTSEEPDDTTFGFPTLPPLDTKTTEETDEALRRIREQISAAGPSTRTRRVRRGFVVASGLVTASAVAVLTLGVQFGVVHAAGL